VKIMKAIVLLALVACILALLGAAADGWTW
jgi:hypothetical protein